MSLREADAENLDRILLDTDELGEWHTIDGKRLRVVVDNDALRSRQDLGGILDIHKGAVLYFARAKDLPKRPVPGAIQKFDGKNMRVLTCNDDFGMLEITLTQNRG